VIDPTRKSDFTENLRTLADGEDLLFLQSIPRHLSGRPQYSSSELSPSQHVSYGMLASKAFAIIEPREATAFSAHQIAIAS